MNKKIEILESVKKESYHLAKTCAEVSHEVALLMRKLNIHISGSDSAYAPHHIRNENDDWIPSGEYSLQHGFYGCTNDYLFSSDPKAALAPKVYDVVNYLFNIGIIISCKPKEIEIYQNGIKKAMYYVPKQVKDYWDYMMFAFKNLFTNKQIFN